MSDVDLAVELASKEQRPSIEAMRLPVALLDNRDPQIASAARIMSGTVARRRPQGAYGRGTTHPDAALIARYRKAHEVGEVSDLLAALGNSVGSRVLPIIDQALHDPRDSVRAAAARALRLAEAPEIDALLSVAITSDGEPQVRSAAIFATSFRRPTSPLGEALVQAARADPVAYVRSSAVSLLRQHPEASPNIAEEPGVGLRARRQARGTPLGPRGARGRFPPALPRLCLAFGATSVSSLVKSVGKPDARNGHVRFDERGRETAVCQ